MKTNKPEVVAWRWRKPVVNDQGETVGTTAWELSDTPGFLPWWTNDPLVRLSDYEDLQAECEKLRKNLENSGDSSFLKVKEKNDMSNYKLEPVAEEVTLFECDSCNHLYQDQVTRCDCMPEEQKFNRWLARPEQQPFKSSLVLEAASHLTNWLNMNLCECEDGHHCGYNDVKSTRDALLSAAPVVQGEPVGYVRPHHLKMLRFGKVCGITLEDKPDVHNRVTIPLYTAPQPTEQQPLTCQECGGDGAGGEHEEDCEMAQVLSDAGVLVEALEKIVAIELQYSGADWEEIQEAQEIASDALAAYRKQQEDQI